MKILLCSCLIGVIMVLQAKSQDAPEKSILKWMSRQENASESWLSPNGAVVLIVNGERKILSLDWSLNERSKGEVEFIDTKTGQPISKIVFCNGRKFGVGSFNFEGNLWAVTCQTGKAELWDIKLSKLIKDFYPTKGVEIEKLTLSPDGTRLVTFETVEKLADYRVVLWNTQTGKVINELYPNLTSGDRNANTFLAFSDNNQMIAVSYNADVYLWNADNGRQICMLTDKNLVGHKGTHKSPSYTMEFSSDATKLITGSSDTKFKIWGTDTGELLKILEGHKGRGLAAAFNSNGNFVATSDWDETVKLWEVISGKLIWSSKIKYSAFHLQFSRREERLLASSYDMQPFILDVNTGSEIWRGKGWWQIDKDWKYIIHLDKKAKQVKLFQLN